MAHAPPLLALKGGFC